MGGKLCIGNGVVKKNLEERIFLSLSPTLFHLFVCISLYCMVIQQTPSLEFFFFRIGFCFMSSWLRVLFLSSFLF